MRIFITLLLISAAFSQEPKFEDVISYSIIDTLAVDTVVDGYRSIPYDTKMRKIIVCFEVPGDSSSTIFDIKKVDMDTARSILGADNYPTVVAGDNRHCVEFIPDKTIEVFEKDVLRLDVLQAATGPPKNFRIDLFVEKGIYK